MKKLSITNLLTFGLVTFLAFGFVQNTNADRNFQTEVNLKGEIIVAVTGARLRSQPSLKSRIVGFSKLGEVYSVVSKRRNWYQISLNSGRSAWISGTIVEDYDDSRRGLIYQKLADKYLAREKLDFKTASEAFGFLAMTRNRVENKNVRAALELKRLRMLNRTLEALPFDKLDQEPYKTFTNINRAEIAYSEPAGQWLVRADTLWDLREKYSDLPIADDIAWEAANTMLPGECEGFIGCHFPLMVMTDGRYLKYYPNGKYSKKALDVVIQNLNEMAGNTEFSYEPLYDDSERSEFNKSVRELRASLNRVSSPDRRRALRLLNQVEKKYIK